MEVGIFFCNILRKNVCKCFCILLWCRRFTYFTGVVSCLLLLGVSMSSFIPKFVLFTITVGSIVLPPSHFSVELGFFCLVVRLQVLSVASFQKCSVAFYSYISFFAFFELVVVELRITPDTNSYSFHTLVLFNFLILMSHSNGLYCKRHSSLGKTFVYVFHNLSLTYLYQTIMYLRFWWTRHI